MVRRLRWSLPVAIAVVLPLLFAGWTLAAVFAASPSPSASGSASSASGAASAPLGDPAKGAQLFGQNCATCHGSNLEGGVGPKLNPIEQLPGVSNPKDPAFIETTIKNGRAGQGQYAGSAMPAFGGKLSDQDIQDLAAFIIQQNQSGASGLTAVDLARSNVFWVTAIIALLVLVTWLLARYNMRWIARRATERQGRGPGST
jgi:mono/diheme cytochrome c family protein